jgi:hypothetical protein
MKRTASYLRTGVIEVKLLRRLMFWRRPKPVEQIPPSMLLPPELRELWQKEILRQAMPVLKFEEAQRMGVVPSVYTADVLAPLTLAPPIMLPPPIDLMPPRTGL